MLRVTLCAPSRKGDTPVAIDVPTGKGRRWVLIGYLPRDFAEPTLTDWIAALGDDVVSNVALPRTREYRIAWDGRHRRWCLFVR